MARRLGTAGIVAHNCIPVDCTEFAEGTGRNEDWRPEDDGGASATFARREVAEAAWCGYAVVVLVLVAPGLAVGIILAFFPH